MEERKTAFWVLSVLLLIIVFFSLIIPYINRRREHVLEYKSCRVKFNYIYNVDSMDIGYIAAQNKLGYCLCEHYKQIKDDTIKHKIIQLYTYYGSTLDSLKVHNINIDTILKYDDLAFNDSVIVID